MSMRHYGVEITGLVMTSNELLNLILDGDYEIIKKYIVADNKWDINMVDVDEFSNCINNTTMYYDVDGKLFNYEDWGDKSYFDNENVVVSYLQKDNLFEKYENMDEIKQELKDNYKKRGIELTDDFIEKHFGRFNGVYWG